MRVFGQIENAYTEKPLPGALVTLSVGDTELIEHTPAKDGQFEYEIPDETIPIDEEVLTCIVEKKGYKTQTTSYAITDEIELAIELVPILVNWKRIFIITGIVLGSLLLLALIAFGIKYFFFGPKEYPIKTFKVKPGTINAGEKAKIKWKTDDADAVFLGGEELEEEEDKVEPSGTQTVSPAKTRKYFLTVKEDDGKQVAREWLELKVIPPPPQILSFTAKPMEINPWDPAVLEWKTIGAEEISIISDPEAQNMRINPQRVHRESSDSHQDTPGAETRETPVKKKELSGSIEVFPLETTTFTLAAVNIDGVKNEKSVEIKVLNPPEILSFTSNIHTIDPGESVILSWDTRGADQVLLNGQRTGSRYSQEVQPKETTTYILKARNKVAERQSNITVTVRSPEVPEPTAPLPSEPPRIHRFHISAPVIARGESTVLTWVTDYADKVYLTIKPVDVDLNIPPADPTAATHKNREIIAGKPLETGEVMRVKPVDSMRVSPRVNTRYQLRAINALKEVSWTRTVQVKPITCTVILYELENYKGEFMEFTTDAAEIGELANRVSSIKIIGNCGVKVFSARDFKATHQEFLESVPRLRGTWIGSNTISSFKLINYPGVKK